MTGEELKNAHDTGIGDLSKFEGDCIFHSVWHTHTFEKDSDPKIEDLNRREQNGFSQRDLDFANWLNGNNNPWNKPIVISVCSPTGDIWYHDPQQHTSNATDHPNFGAFGNKPRCMSRLPQNNAPPNEK